MQQSYANKFFKNGFLLSIFLHALLLILIFLRILIIPLQEKKEKPPTLYTPAYVYHGVTTPQVKKQHLSSEKVNVTPKQSTPAKQYKPQFSTGDLPLPPVKKPIKQKSMLTASYEFLKENQRQMISSLKYEDPIYLIGEPSKAPDPLVRLLAYALSLYFNYPPMAGEFGQKGKVVIGMTLHPDGHLSDIEMLSSSNNSYLDHAALFAVNKAPLVKRAHQFISNPKHFVIGFIFRTTPQSFE